MNNEMNNADDNLDLDAYTIFPSTIYFGNGSKFLNDASSVANENLETLKAEFPKPNEINPAYQTDDLSGDIRMSEFCEYIGNSGHNILRSQGYNMDIFSVNIKQVICEEHQKFSLMKERSDLFDSQLVGFYFLEVPENSSKLVLHDPRPAKKFINLPQVNEHVCSDASVSMNFASNPGSFIFFNSWIPFTFTKNASDKPFKFIYFKLGVVETRAEPYHSHFTGIDYSVGE